MQTLTLNVRSDKDGIVRLEIPTNITDREIEIVLVIQAHDDEPLDEMGYPIGYFEETYGIFADNPIERNQPFHKKSRSKDIK
jgi:hypothetical protein